MSNPHERRNDTGGVSSDVKSALKGIRGAGDAIRGTATGAVDNLFHSKEGEVRNQAIADKGMADLRNTDDHFGRHHGVNKPFPHGDNSRDHPSQPAHSAHDEDATTTTTTTTKTTRVAAIPGSAAANAAPDTSPSSGATAHHPISGNVQSHQPPQSQPPNHSTGFASKLASAGHGQDSAEHHQLGQGAHSGAAGNLESNPVPQDGLGGEPQSRTERF